MELITTQIKIKNVAKHWREQYFYYGKGWQPTVIGNAEMIYEKLLSLPEAATADDVIKIIGNDSWVTMTCNECKQKVEAVVMLGDDYDFDSNTAFICLDCLKSATKLIEEITGG